MPVAYYRAPSGYFVRADVTYLRQDFSLEHFVPDADPWPEKQRFDYFVRTRPLTNDEIVELTDVDGVPSANTDKKHDYPQRNAVLRALRTLADEDAGEQKKDWERWLLAKRR